MDIFNIFSENMMTCLEGSYPEAEAIDKAKEQSKTTATRWIVHDKTGKPHYVAVRGEIFTLGSDNSAKVEHLENLVIHLANIIAEFVDTDPSVTAGMLSEWLDHATSYEDGIGWRVNYPNESEQK